MKPIERKSISLSLFICMNNMKKILVVIKNKTIVVVMKHPSFFDVVNTYIRVKKVGKLRISTYFFAFFRWNSWYDLIFFIKDDTCDACKHLLEMFLKFGNTFAVADNLQKIFITNEIKPRKFSIRHVSVLRRLS